MKVKNESELECACRRAGYDSGDCQCQYDNWPAVENRHQSCDFCGERAVTHSLNDGAWWVCKPCFDVTHIRMDIALRGEEE